MVAATTFPDLLVPGFGSMVHGELTEFSPIEVVSTHGVCCCGMTALKYAAAMVQLGQKQTAISTASELPSRLFKNTRFEAETKIQQGKHVDFDTEFLRWMLSDGAGAAVVQPQPTAGQLSLSIEWIELISYAHELPVCMYTGRNRPDSEQNWMDYPSTVEAAAAGALDLRQNIRLLDKAVSLGSQGIPPTLQQKGVNVDDIDWFLCHYSSHFFRDKVKDHLDLLECSIPQEKWFTNLYTRGNTGAASMYLMLEELLYSGKLKPNQTLFCVVPESGRFSTAYMLLKTVVG
ncbi:MAG: 3-oxoacyl-[acyl-carrier-protein] synthase III C-terminal domain-containing protein [Phormidesmis sp.]